MRLYLLNNKRAVLFGADARCINADTDGTLHIGITPVTVTKGERCGIPCLTDGPYKVTFECADGTYLVGTHTVRNGLLAPSKKYSENELDLLLRVEALERAVATLTEKVEHLVKRFDTNSLNYLTGDN
ncbi:MAG: hypothetical protein IJY01_00405 [Clostridia bacterium]|nr:hypothetical protein [Clostridia bacterium]